MTFGDGDVERAFGLFSGKNATLNKIELHYLDGEVYKATSIDLVEDVPADTVLFQQAGGGDGDSCLRDPDQVAQEVKNGVISFKKAKEEYSVVVDIKAYEVNQKETGKLRKTNM